MTDTAAEEVGQDRQRQQIIASSERIFHGTEIMIDQEARDMAAQALAKENAHEVLCTERWGQQKETMADIKKAVGEVKDALTKRVPITFATITSALFALIGYLAARAFPMH